MENPQIFVVIVLYMLVVIGIGFYFYKRSQKNTENYYLGGRSLNPWVTAMSAEASDMSGWLLMGLPGVAYWCGLADAFWTALGLALGTYINWLIVAKRLRHYSEVSGNAITVPDFLSNRFKEKNKIILGIASVFIVVFFTVYAASCFATCGKFFGTLFGWDYHMMLFIGAAFVVLYTLIGGFLAESVSDFMQAVVMIVALVAMIAVGVINAGGFGAVIENAKAIPGYFSLTELANPLVDANGKQLSSFGKPLFGEASSYGVLNMLSMLAWGLGYFGMPQVLLRFMAIRKSSELRRSRIIATVWCVVSLTAAVFIGIIGRSLLPVSEVLGSKSGAESILIEMATTYLPLILAGLIMAGILAATISSSDSYLLIASSAVSVNIYKGIFKANKEVDEKKTMNVSRIVLLVIALVGILIAWDEESIIFNIVSFAWSGFGATFGPLMLFSLFWKRTTRQGAIAGMITGGAMVFIWKLVLNNLLSDKIAVFGIYELLPAFILSSIVIVVVSLLTPKPSAEIEEEFEKVKAM
ncbi:MAG: sodium/proline symporter [Clostridia bacterium]|nr:sodium/proline symporter [Clostridia bacterium]